MTLVKTKKRITTHQKKVAGSHHRKSQHYTKTYWPYLPIVAILAGSAAISQFFVTSPLVNFVSPTDSGQASVVGGSLYLWLMYAAIISLIVWFSIRHIKRIKKLILASEHVLAKHYLLDVVLAVVIGGLIIAIH